MADVENMLVIMINRILPPSPSPEATTGGQPLGGGERVEQEGGSGEGVGDSGGGVGKESGKVEGDGVEEGEGQRAGDPVQEGQEGEGEGYNGIHVGPIPRMTCHVLETNDVSHEVFKPRDSQSNATQYKCDSPKTVIFNEKMSCLRRDSNPQHSAF